MVTGVTLASRDLSPGQAVFSITCSAVLVIFHLPLSSPRLNWLNIFGPSSVSLLTVSVVRGCSDLRLLGMIRDLFLPSIPSGLVLSHLILLVSFPQNQLKSQIPVGNGGYCCWAKVNGGLHLQAQLEYLELFLQKTAANNFKIKAKPKPNKQTTNCETRDC